MSFSAGKPAAEHASKGSFATWQSNSGSYSVALLATCLVVELQSNLCMHLAQKAFLLKAF